MKQKLLKIINPIIFLLFISQGVTGFMMGFSASAYEVHTRLIWVLFFGVFIHIILNWSWIKTIFFKRKKKKAP
jgi:hypothetical protein